jgi:hypothetical protein
MTRKIKTLGVALVAVFALTAVMASAASAASYTATTYPTTATGESALGNDVFTTEAGAVECKAHFVGTLTAASSDLTVTPTYTNCKVFGFDGQVTGCKYTFTAVSTTSSNVDVVNPCTIIGGNCHVTVDNQNSLSSVATTNNAAGDVSVQANVSAIKYTVVKDGFLCPFVTDPKKPYPQEKFGGTYKQGTAITFDAVNPATASIGVS